MGWGTLSWFRKNWPQDCLRMADGCDMVLRSKIGKALARALRLPFRTCRAAESLGFSIRRESVSRLTNGIEDLNLFASLRV